MVAEVEQVIVGMGACDADRLGKDHPVLDPAHVGNHGAGWFVGRNRRKIRHRLCPRRLPGAEILFHCRPRLFCRYPADDHDRRHVGTEDFCMIRPDVGKGNSCHRFRSGVAERRVVCGEEPLAQGPPREVAGTLEPPAERADRFLLDDGKCSLGKGGPQQVVRQEFHAPVETLRLDPKGKRSSRKYFRSDIVLGLLESDSVKRPRAVGKEAAQEV